MSTGGVTAAYGGDPFSQDPAVQPSLTPLWREAFFPLDWFSLRSSPVYYGCGIARGRGEPVVVIPGFLETDFAMSELHAWLTRVGYRAWFSNIGHNADCPNHLSGILLDTVRGAYRETGQKVRLIGHSLGGMLARSVALEYPEYVSLVIAVGSPFRDAVRAHPVVMAAADALRSRHGPGGGRYDNHHGPGAHVRPSCFSGHCTCVFTKNVLDPGDFKMPHYAIFSKRDGVVEWESCIEDNPALNDEVTATHLGMPFHPGVYRALARRLRQA